MNLNWLDYLLASILLLSLIGAIRNGLAKEIIRLVALAAGITAGLWWYPEVGAHFQPWVADEGIAGFAGFVAIFLGVLAAGMLVAWVTAMLLGWAGLRWFDRLLGGAFGLLRGLLISSALVLGLLAFAPLTRSAEAVAESQVAPWVLHTSQVTSWVAPSDLRQAYEKGLERVQEIWRQKLASPPPATSHSTMPAPRPSPLRVVSAE
jgi:membrane protein required for colicin V production